MRDLVIWNIIFIICTSLTFSQTHTDSTAIWQHQLDECHMDVIRLGSAYPSNHQHFCDKMDSIFTLMFNHYKTSASTAEKAIAIEGMLMVTSSAVVCNCMWRRNAIDTILQNEYKALSTFQSIIKLHPTIATTGYDVVSNKSVARQLLLCLDALPDSIRQETLNSAVTNELYGVNDSNKIQRARFFAQKLEQEFPTSSAFSDIAYFVDVNFPIRKGKKIPDFFLWSLDDKDSVSNTSLLGRWYMIDVWGVGCKPCLQAFPHLASIFEKYKGKKGFTIIGIVTDEPKRATTIINQYGIQWKQYDAFRTSVVKDLTAGWMPYYILVNDKGEVAAVDYELRHQHLDETLHRLLEN
ncbi:MAG: TlpA disulfide reductase family protein [Candidatus Kapaibacterium sp.]|nr:TlpA family protein disulfide reductase [Bacteroidota bacterium]